MNKRHYEHTLPNIRGSLSNTYTLSQKGRICRKYTSSRRIKRDSGPLHLIKHNGDGRE